MTDTSPQQDIQVATHSVFTTPSEPRAGMMVPHFETVALHKKAQALKETAPIAGGWGIASLSMAVGVGATALALYAFDQDVDKAVANVLWTATAALVLIAFILWRVRRKDKEIHAKAIDNYCDELRMLVHRYGGGGAEQVIQDMDSQLPLTDRETVRTRLRVLRRSGSGPAEAP
jgi:hypothetical protein